MLRGEGADELDDAQRFQVRLLLPAHRRARRQRQWSFDARQQRFLDQGADIVRTARDAAIARHHRRHAAGNGHRAGGEGCRCCGKCFLEVRPDLRMIESDLRGCCPGVEPEPASDCFDGEVVGCFAVRHEQASPVVLVCRIDGLLQFGCVRDRFALRQLCGDLDAGERACDALEHLVDDGICVDDLTGQAEVDRQRVIDDDHRWGSRRDTEVSGVGQHGSSPRPIDEVPALGELGVCGPPNPRLSASAGFFGIARSQLPNGPERGVSLQRNAEVGHRERLLAGVGAHDDRRGRQLRCERGDPQVHSVGAHLGRRAWSCRGNDDWRTGSRRRG